MVMDRTTFANRFDPKGKKIDKWTENRVKGRANYEQLKTTQKIVRGAKKILNKKKPRS